MAHNSGGTVGASQGGQNGDCPQFRWRLSPVIAKLRARAPHAGQKTENREVGRSCEPRDLSSSPGRTRTSDHSVNSRTLYRLSYRGPRSVERDAQRDAGCSRCFQSDAMLSGSRRQGWLRRYRRNRMDDSVTTRSRPTKRDADGMCGTAPSTARRTAARPFCRSRKRTRPW